MSKSPKNLVFHGHEEQLKNILVDSLFCLEKAIVTHEHKGDGQTAAAVTLIALGNLHHSLGRLETAREHLKEARSRLNFGGNRYWEAVACKHLGQVYRTKGEIVMARVVLKEGWELAGSVGANKLQYEIRKCLEEEEPSPSPA
ncbi:MAG: tetratricopeptide repeat protein [Syntrophales bacterium]|nr:tetratricopeptide repeat protein [Syntrophales bacterium]